MNPHARYRAGSCMDCGQRRHSAGRPRCNECHTEHQGRLIVNPADVSAETTTVLSTVVADTPAELGAHALAYAKVGLPVLPLRPREKIPATRHGKDDATTDPHQVRQWWSRNPDCNIGVRPPTGVVVIDVDPRNSGDQALTTLLDGRRLPHTWTCRTGSGGQHIWLRHAGPNRATLCTGVDLKDHRGYLVMPPSIHPNGRHYGWETHQPIAHAPAWLQPLLTPAPPPPPKPVAAAPASPDALVNFVAQAAEGNRNHALFWAACRAANEGTLSDLTAQLVAAAVTTGLSEAAARATIRSAEKRSAS